MNNYKSTTFLFLSFGKAPRRSSPFLSLSLSLSHSPRFSRVSSFILFLVSRFSLSSKPSISPKKLESKNKNQHQSKEKREREERERRERERDGVNLRDLAAMARGADDWDRKGRGNKREEVEKEEEEEETSSSSVSSESELGASSSYDDDSSSGEDEDEEAILEEVKEEEEEEEGKERKWRRN